MHEDQTTDPIEESLSRAFEVGGPELELPDVVRVAVGARRTQRRRRQLVGASAFVVVLVTTSALWMTRMSAPGNPPVAQIPIEGPLIVRVGGCGDSTVIGLMRCNNGFENLESGEIILSDDWDLGWVGSTPAIEPGDM